MHMFTALADRPWAPFVLDGWRGAAPRTLRQEFGRLAVHAMLTVRDGRGEAVLDGRAHPIRPGRVLLAQPGQRLAWTHPRDAYVHAILFDCEWRRRRVLRGAAFAPGDGRPAEPLSLLWDRDIPCLLDGGLGELASSTLGAIGDLWWRDAGDRLLANARLAAFLAQLLQRLGSAQQTPAGPWQQLMVWAERQLEHGVRVEDMAAEAGLQRASFTRAWQAAHGIPPGRWLRDRRLDRARRLLRDSDLDQAQVALHCGYRSRAAFEMAFRSAAGCSPRVWRRSEASAWQGASDRAEPPFPRRPETVYRPK